MAAAAAARTQRQRAHARPAGPRPKRASGNGQLIPLAVGRTAVAVRQLPDSSLMVRMTRGRAWIAVLGVLLVGIVALNVVTLSFSATAGRVDQASQALSQENSILSGRDAKRSGAARVRHEGLAQGLVMPSADQVHYLQASPQDVAVAAQRLAAAGAG